MEGAISHDQVIWMLSCSRMTSKERWRLVKPQVRKLELEDGVIIIDDSIIEKPYTDENEIICWHYDHAKGHIVKTRSFLNMCSMTCGLRLLHIIARSSKMLPWPNHSLGLKPLKQITSLLLFGRLSKLSC